jgi:ABC-type nickel/cobalt efflux system permease component RcnA
MSDSERPAPPPLEANDQRVTIVGTVAWAVALVVVLVLRAEDSTAPQWWVWTCVAGICMGLFALWYVPRLKRARARKAQRRAEIRAASAQSCPSDSKTVSSTETPGTSTRS